MNDSEPTANTALRNPDIFRRVVNFVFATLALLQTQSFLCGATDLDPLEIGKWPPSVNGPAGSVVVEGQYAYCTITSDTGFGWVPGLIVFDVKSPANPVPVGYYETGALDPGDVCVSGGYAYLAVHESLVVLDVSDPANPTEIGRCRDLGFVAGPRGLVVAGNHVYFAGDSLRIIDVGDKNNPRLVGSSAAGIRNSFRDVALSGNYACVAEWANGTGRVRVFDVSNPANPVQVGIMSQIGPANAICVAGSHAYVVTAERNLHVVDISNPAVPLRVGDLSGVGPYAVAVSGSHVYVGQDSTGFITAGGLRVIDVSDPVHPQFKGDYRTGGLTSGLFVSGNHTYVANGDDGLRIVEVSNPSLPRGTGSHDTAPFDAVTDMVVAGGSAYLATVGGGLQIFDVSDPSHPGRLGIFAMDGLARGISVIGNHVYFAEQPRWTGEIYTGGGLHVIDVSNPSNPQPVSSYGSGQYFGRIFTSGNYAYTEVPGEGLKVIDISDPASLQPRGGYAATALCFVSGKYAFVTGVRDSVEVVEIVDVSNPDDPARAGVYIPAGTISGMKIVVSGNTACLAAPGNDVELVDVSNPAAPVLVSRYNNKPGLVIGTSLMVADNRAYVGHDWGVDALGFEIVDVSDPANPRMIGDYYDEAFGLFVSGDYAYRTWRDLSVVDLRRAANPQRTGSYAAAGASIRRGGVAVAGSRAFVADGTNGLQVLDVTNPANPQRLGGYDTSGSAEDVFVSGNLAYIADWDGGLKIVDVSNPASPQTVSSLILPENSPGWPEVAERVFVSGNFAYVTGYGLNVIDVSNPAQPVWVGGAQPPSGNLGLFVSGQYAYLVAEGLHIYDVSNPANPQRVGGVNTGLDSYDVFVSGNFAYVANEDTGLHVIDVSNPTDPRRVGGYYLTYAWSVVVSNNYAYVMSRNSGLNVLDVSNPAKPRRVGGNTAVGGIVNYGGAADLAAVGGRVYVLAGGRGLFLLNEFQALRLEIPPPLASGSFRFLLHGPAGLSGRIQRSVNLRDWTDWRPFTLGDVPIEFLDPDAGSYASQFYRAVSP